VEKVSLFWKINPLTAIKIGAVLAVAGYIYYLQNTNSKLQERMDDALIRIGQQEVTISTQQETIKTIEQNVALVLNNIGTLQQSQRSLFQEYNRRRNEIEGYRGRLADLSLAKPGLVELKANQALRKSMNEIKEATDMPQENQNE
jgi:regulator of replication initiation timing